MNIGDIHGKNDTVMKWLRELLSKEGKLSSKRVALMCLLAWILTTGTFYVVKVQYGGKESLTTIELLIASLYTAGGLAVGGTAAEVFSNKKGEDE